MYKKIASFLVAASLLPGCKVGCVNCLGYGLGPEVDGRFVTDLKTWLCRDPETGRSYEGAFAFDLSLEYAPDALDIRQLPSVGGCSYGLNLFADSAGEGGLDIPELDDEPTWVTSVDEGELSKMSAGYYRDEVFEDERTCQEAGRLLESGAELGGAWDLTGATTPAPGVFTGASLNGEDSQAAGFVLGEVIDVDWVADGWDTSWLQLRREDAEGTARETVTCNTTGLDAFTIDDQVWSMVTTDLPGVMNNVYVGFQNTDEFATEGGQRVEVATRAMHVAVIVD